jgi:hypothetical protein
VAKQDVFLQVSRVDAEMASAAVMFPVDRTESWKARATVTLDVDVGEDGGFGVGQGRQ